MTCRSLARGYGFAFFLVALTKETVNV